MVYRKHRSVPPPKRSTKCYFRPEMFFGKRCFTLLTPACLYPLFKTAAKQLLRPNVIRPATHWHSVSKAGEGGSRGDGPAGPHDGQKAAVSLRRHPARRNCVKATSTMLARRKSEDEVLELPESPEPARPKEEDGTVPKPGPSVARTREARPTRQEEVINVEEVVLVAEREGRDRRDGESQPRRVPDLGGAVRCIQENARLDHPYFQPAGEEACPAGDRLSPRPAQLEVELGPLPRVYQEEIPGPAFPRPEPQQDGIPGPASPRLAHPPEEKGGHPEAINEQAGPAFPVQGSLESGASSVFKQATPWLDKDLTALLVRETVSANSPVNRAGDVGKGFRAHWGGV